jgi:hypothetical protein
MEVLDCSSLRRTSNGITRCRDRHDVISASLESRANQPSQSQPVQDQYSRVAKGLDQTICAKCRRRVDRTAGLAGQTRGTHQSGHAKRYWGHYKFWIGTGRKPSQLRQALDRRQSVICGSRQVCRTTTCFRSFPGFCQPCPTIDPPTSMEESNMSNGRCYHDHSLALVSP